MGFRRRRVGAVIIAAVAFTLAAAPSPGSAASLDACAQRVIRDWYTGGRIDDVYPLACYRAALRSLPDDVLQYSNADQDIRRALAFARRGRSDPGNRPTTAQPATQEKSRPTTSTRPAAPAPAPVANEAASPVSKAPLVAETRSSATSVPFPILVLAALAGVLLVAGGVGWLASRSR
jgi:hypothetical protein